MCIILRYTYGYLACICRLNRPHFFVGAINFAEDNPRPLEHTYSKNSWLYAFRFAYKKLYTEANLKTLDTSTESRLRYITLVGGLQQVAVLHSGD